MHCGRVVECGENLCRVSGVDSRAGPRGEVARSMIGEGCGSIAGENLCGNVAPSLSQVRVAPHRHPSPPSIRAGGSVWQWRLVMFPRFSSFFGILRGFGQACAGRMLGRGEWLAGVCPRQQGERVLRERGAAWLRARTYACCAGEECSCVWCCVVTYVRLWSGAGRITWSCIARGRATRRAIRPWSECLFQGLVRRSGAQKAGRQLSCACVAVLRSIALCGVCSGCRRAWSAVARSHCSRLSRSMTMFSLLCTVAVSLTLETTRDALSLSETAAIAFTPQRLTHRKTLDGPAG